MVGETWQKLAIVSGVLSLGSAWYLPVLRLDFPESISNGLELLDVEQTQNAALTLRNAQEYIEIARQLRVIDQPDGGIPIITLSVDVALYGIIIGATLLILGGILSRKIALFGVGVQAVITGVVAYAVFLGIPNYIRTQIGAGPIRSEIGVAASQIVNAGIGMWLLIVAVVIALICAVAPSST